MVMATGIYHENKYKSSIYDKLLQNIFWKKYTASYDSY